MLNLISESVRRHWLIALGAIAVVCWYYALLTEGVSVSSLGDRIWLYAGVGVTATGAFLARRAGDHPSDRWASLVGTALVVVTLIPFVALYFIAAAIGAGGPAH